ncbi:MAG: flagellar hook-basal body protein [Solirubrobacteraceae bacterium]
MYAAISGLEAHQTMLDVTANNLANVDTVGFKAQRTTFVDELSQLVRASAGPNGNVAGSNPEQVGLGVTVGSIDNLMTTGSLQSTGNPTDVAIQGDGFLRVTTGDPSTPLSATQQIEYTRNGDMTINPKGYLTTQEGQYIVGRGATPSGTAPNIAYSPNSTDGYINVPPGSTDVAIGQDGSVSYVDQNSSNATYQQRVTAGYLTLSTFPNEAGLTRMGGSLWTESAASGIPSTGTPNTAGFGQTIAGTLEMSNVDMATEFTNMIQAERGYQANSSVISTADQMLQTLVQLRS